jgi:hypothetical protein
MIPAGLCQKASAQKRVLGAHNGNQTLVVARNILYKQVSAVNVLAVNGVLATHVHGTL